MGSRVNRVDEKLVKFYRASTNMNTILEDISAVIGFSATLKLVAWFGGRRTNIYVPEVAEDGLLLPQIIGMPAARLLSREWPKKHLNVPMLHNYDTMLRHRHIATLLRQGVSCREIATQLEMSERRVVQIKSDLESRGLVDAKTPSKPDQAAAVVPIRPAAQGQTTKHHDRPVLTVGRRRSN